MPLKGTLTGSYTAPVTLTSSGYTNPVTVTGTISLSSAGIDLRAATTWSIVNAGLIESTASGVAYGISLGAGGYIDNLAGSAIRAYIPAAISGAAGRVTNAGTLAGGPSDSNGLQLGAGGTVTNAGSALISGGLSGVLIFGGAGTVSNSGTILGGTTAGTGISLENGGYVYNFGTVSGDYGVALRAAGGVTNATGAVIAGGADNGVEVLGGVGTVRNAGSITNSGSAYSAIYFNQGGSIDNATGGVISSTFRGIHAYGVTTVTNAGRITSSNTSKSAIGLNSGGTVVNAAGGVIASSYQDIYISGGGTVTNAGTIAATGANTIAVNLVGGSANQVIVDPGAVFSGAVDGGNAIGSSIVSTLELGPGTGTLAGIGSAITNFSAITFDPGAAWDVSGVLAGFGGTVSGFAPGDTIHLTDVVANSGTYAAGQLNLYDSGSPVGHIAVTGAFVHHKFTVDPVTGITVACFVSGTRVLTEAGEVEVERLQPGARVVSVLHRKLLRVAWIGHRGLRDAWPVRVCAGAFGAGQPHRDLWLSPDHALFVEGVLIPVRYLVNGATIVQEHRDEVCYFHVELAEHGVLLAEGLPAESYLDTGNRAAFANGGASVQMNPDFARGVWQRDACAKLATDGYAVVAARERLHARAERLGWTTTDAPAPLLLADGQRIAPHPGGDDVVTFVLPPGCRHASLQSRATIPAYMHPRSTDHRRLGMAVAALAFDGVDVALNDARLGAGWHAPEPGLRWTDGDACIALAGERSLTGAVS